MVRQILAYGLKSVAGESPAVNRQIARDTEYVVASPVLEFSPLLSDEDLLEIIASSGLSSRLCAIARRSSLGETISDAIVLRNDRPAVSALLANGSAQIREENLDRLIAASVQEPAWPPALVARPVLPAGAGRRPAGLVATPHKARGG